jgi:hypothetical protein
MLKTSTPRVFADELARMLTLGRCISQRTSRGWRIARAVDQWALIAGKVEIASLTLGQITRRE